MKITIVGCGNMGLIYARAFLKYNIVSKENLLQQVSDTLLQTQSRVSNIVMDQYLNTETRDNYIKSAIINVMSTPEYQLC